MGILKRSPVLFLLLTLLLWSACTIFSDDAITTAEELDKLKLKEVAISQATTTGDLSGAAVLLGDSVVSIAAGNVTITRRLWFSMPSLGSNSKLKYKSGATGAIKTQTS